MKKMILLFSSLFLSVFTPVTVLAQKGDGGIGLRLTPDGAGFTAKYFVTNDLALEGQLNAGGVFGLEGQSVTVVGLMEYHITLPDPHWRIFFGGGIHFGAWDRDNDDGQGIFGIDGIGGVSYNFSRIPIELTGDLKPAINFVSDVDFFPHNLVGAAGRYYFARHAPRTHR